MKKTNLKKSVFVITSCLNLCSTDGMDYILDTNNDYLKTLQKYKSILKDTNELIHMYSHSFQKAQKKQRMSHDNKKKQAQNIINLKKKKCHTITQLLETTIARAIFMGLLADNELDAAETTTVQQYIRSIQNNVLHTASQELKSIKDTQLFAIQYKQIYEKHTRLKECLETIHLHLNPGM